MSATGRSTSWASTSGGTGSWATSTTASIACRNSSSASATGTASASLMSAIVGVDGESHGGVGGIASGPLDHDRPEVLGLVELDEALLEQLEHGEEAHDHVEAIGERIGQAGERDPPRPRQLVD